MYDFINNYPKARENGWSNEIQGVCHDDDNWYFTQKTKLWKFPVTWDLNEKIDPKDPPAGVFSTPRPNSESNDDHHLGDMDHYQGFIFIADQWEDYNACISIYRAWDLAPWTQQQVEFNGKALKSIGWCAIRDGYLYTSGSTVDSSSNPVMIYKIDMDKVKRGKPDFLTQHAAIYIHDENGKSVELECMQGGCFDKDDNLYLVNGYWLDLVWERKKEGISVFHVPAVPAKNGVTHVNRISKSSQHGSFQYEFDTSSHEPEGITWWDLDIDTRAPGIRGCLHVLLLDNDSKLGDVDDLYFKHYRHAAPYMVRICTGEKPYAGTDANVSITLHGSKGDSPTFRLQGSDAAFTEGSASTFRVYSHKDLGDLEKITISHDNSGREPEWYLQDVHVTSVNSQKSWHFPCGQWLYRQGRDLKNTLTLSAQPGYGTEYTYTVRIRTGDTLVNAGTDANVFIRLHGKTAISQEFKLDSTIAHFEKGSVDTFKLMVPKYLGPLTQLDIRHDNTGACPNWYVAEISVTDTTFGRKWTFPCNNWLYDRDDKRLRRSLYPA